MDKNVTITLTVNAWNVVLNALSQRPYVEVSELVEEFKKQAAPQVSKIDDTKIEETPPKK